GDGTRVRSLGRLSPKPNYLRMAGRVQSRSGVPVSPSARRPLTLKATEGCLATQRGQWANVGLRPGRGTRAPRRLDRGSPRSGIQAKKEPPQHDQGGGWGTACPMAKLW